MTSIDYLRELLHQVAGVLVWPVLLGLICLCIFVLISIGMCLRQLWERQQRKSERPEKVLVSLSRCAEEYGNDTNLDLRLEQIIQNADQRKMRVVRRVRMAVRLGPSLGLMGTLIPMADALQGLADGNLPQLASNMVTAFAATVVGLLVSVIAYIVSSVQESWAREDSLAASFHAEHLLRRCVEASSSTLEQVEQ